MCGEYELPEPFAVVRGVSKMKYRITRFDCRNWCIEKLVQGGKVIDRGKAKGKVSTTRWVNQGLYYARLKDAARGLLDILMGEGDDGELVRMDARELLRQLEKVETRTMAAFDRLEEQFHQDAAMKSPRE